jgi:hypothetical protein
MLLKLNHSFKADQPALTDPFPRWIVYKTSGFATPLLVSVGPERERPVTEASVENCAVAGVVAVKL